MLRPFHDGDPIFISRGRKPHPVLGDVIYGHLTLRNLKDHYASEYSKFNAYDSYALMRNPVQRFVSSLSQFMREMKGIDTKKFSVSNYIEACEEVCSYLEDHTQIEDHSYIHFQRQISYIFLDGKKITRHVWMVDQIDELLRDLEVRTECPLNLSANTRQNATISYRSRSAEFFHIRLRCLQSSLPRYAIPQWLRSFVRTIILETPPASKIWQELPERRRNMILDYYSDDLEYFRKLQMRKSRGVGRNEIG